jgi:imidazolonepropionase-like amidohydrolase
LRRVNSAVGLGLAADAAVRALTLDAAIIAGVGDRLGSIERGKAANLLVTDGDLLDERTKILHVFVDGRGVALEPATPATRPRRTQNR